jgi:hypothetical protein
MTMESFEMRKCLTVPSLARPKQSTKITEITVRTYELFINAAIRDFSNSLKQYYKHKHPTLSRELQCFLNFFLL